MNRFQQGAAAFNVVMRRLIDAPVVGKFLSRSMAEVSYVGRKSGRRFTLVVAYKRRGDELTIGVAMPEKKGWWRNFHPTGGPIVVHLDGVERTGTAVAHRDGSNVHVKVALD
ncbi:hypothetical protein [Rhodococcus sp. NPDC058521]|uniref:hypothetical protein n=1 Tax=Rhodococcus sp. NPDC058521 TaxID=3346536 RepID=UPI00365FB4BC